MLHEDTPPTVVGAGTVPQSPKVTPTDHHTPSPGPIHVQYQSGGSTSLRSTSDSIHASPSQTPLEKNARSRVQISAVSPPQGRSILPLKQSLGVSGSIVIIVGTVGLLGVFAFLTFLWVGYGSKSEAANATWAWRQMALRGYMEQAITLAALVLTFIVSLQAAVCTSMAAALILEKWSVPKAKHDYTIVGDSGNAPVLSLVPPGATGYDLNSALAYYNTDTGNAIFPVFGEAKPTNGSLDPSTRGLSDTGLVHRAFLPLSESMNRTAVRRYTGNAMALDSRTVCMPPSINGTISMITLDGFNDNLGLLDGLLSYGSALEQATDGVSALCDGSECEQVYFGCSLPAGAIPSSSSCLVGGVGGSVFSAQAVQYTQSWDQSDPAWSQNNSIFLVFSTNMNQASWATFENRSEPLEEGTAYGEWQSFELLPGRHLNASLCFLAYSMDRYYVHMNTSGGLAEPSNLWSVLPPYYDTTATRRYLGLLPDQDTEDYRERGILELEILGDSEQNDTTSAFSNTTANELNTEHLLDQIMYSLLTDMGNFNMSFGTCWNCSYYGQITRGEYMLVLEDILSTTGRAASMLQSYVAMTAFWTYTTVLSSMGTAENVDLAVTSVARTPGPCWGSNSAAGPFTARGCPGYTAVTVLLGVHMLVVAVITVRFARQIQFSRCANIWHAVSQLAASGWLKDHWDRGTDLSDAAYERVVLGTARGLDDDERWVRLDRNVDEGRVEFVRSRRTPRTKQVVDTNKTVGASRT